MDPKNQTEETERSTLDTEPAPPPSDAGMLEEDSWKDDPACGNYVIEEDDGDYD